MSTIKQSMLSLALAGTLTASQFAKNVEDYFPKNNSQDLNIEKKNIQNSKKYTKLTEIQLADQKKHLDIMLDVNNRTFQDLFPALEVSLQKWVKDDKEKVSYILDILLESFNTRIKQYDNLKNACKNTNIPKEYIVQIDKMRTLSNDAKRKIKDFKNKVEILSEAKSIFNNLKSLDIKFSDYWLPTIEDKNNIIFVSVDNIDLDDFETIEKLEVSLNKNLMSNNFDFIAIG